MKFSTFIAACSTTSIMLFTSCNESSTSTAKNTDSNTIEKKQDGNQKMNNPDQAAIDYLVPKNAMELAWLNAGIARGTMPDIKEHSVMMHKDHTKLAADVSAYMQKHAELTMPVIDTSNAVNINDKSGKDWDVAWTDKLIADHEEILRKLDEAISNVRDEELKNMAAKTKVTVQHHLDMGKMIKAKL